MVTENGLYIHTEKCQDERWEAYRKSMEHAGTAYQEKTVATMFGLSRCVIFGALDRRPLVLVYDAGKSASAWYANIRDLSEKYTVYAVDLYVETSGGRLFHPMKKAGQCALWLQQVLSGLGIDRAAICGHAAGAWYAANYAATFPADVEKLILINPVKTFGRIRLPAVFRRSYRSASLRFPSKLSGGMLARLKMPVMVLSKPTETRLADLAF